MVFAAASLLAANHLCFAAGSVHHPAPPSVLDQPGERERLTAALKSADAQQVDAAVAEIRGVVLHKGHQKASDLDLFSQAGREDLGEPMCIAAIGVNAGNTPILTQYVNEWVRIRQAAGDVNGALSAAKAYFNICPLELQSHANKMLAECLAAAHPDDPGIADRFLQQQLAWSFGSPAASGPSTTQPSATQPSATPLASLADPAATQPAAPQLGAAIVPTIPDDTKPFEKLLPSAPPQSYTEELARGNLLILCGRPAEARTQFENAMDAASAKKRASLAKDVARAIKAATGCVGPAEDYLKTQRESNGL